MAHPVTELFTEGHRCDPIVPASRQSVEVNTGWKSMRDFHKAVFLCSFGAIAAAATVDAQLLQATDEFGTGAKAISGKAITPLDGGDDNSSVAIELDSSEMDVTNNYDYILGSMSFGGGAAAVLSAAVLIRYQPRFKPVDDTNFAEIVH